MNHSWGYGRSTRSLHWKVTATADVLVRGNSAKPLAKIVPVPDRPGMYRIVEPAGFPQEFARFRCREHAQNLASKRVRAA
jgi:hypothetical protein